MKVKYVHSGNNYEVIDGTLDEHVTLVFIGHGEKKTKPDGTKYENYCTRAHLDSRIACGDVEVIEDERLPLKIEVDTSPLDKALASAQELEATLLRIKELWPCSGS
jgi:hypothetical protein